MALGRLLLCSGQWVLRAVFQSLSVMLFWFWQADLAVVHVHWTMTGILNLTRVWSVQETDVGWLTHCC